MLNNGLYPSDILQPLSPYVYFMDAPDEILAKASSVLNQPLTSFKQGDTGETNIEQAFSFLKNVIISERAKENAFLQYLKDKTKDSFDIRIPSIDSDWSEFVLEVQQFLDIGSIGIQELQNEYNRLVKNQANYDAEIKGNRDKIKYEDDTIKKVNNDLQKVLSVFKKQTLDSRSLAGQILNIIVNEFGSDLIEVRGDKLLLNKSELMALILTLSEMISQNYQAKKINIQSYNNSDPRIADSFQRAESIDDELIESMKNVVNGFKTFPMLRQQMVRNWQLPAKDRSISSKKFKDKNGNLIERSDILVQEIFKILSDFEIPDGTFEIVQKTNVMAEISSAIKFVSSGANVAINPGKINAKPDNVIAYITGDLSKLDPLKNPRAQSLLAEIESIQRIIQRNMLDPDQGLSNKNTAEYYKKRYAQWDKLTKQLEDRIQKLREEYNFLSSCFLIEDSTKNYLSLYTQEENGEQLTGPHGGSLGASLQDQLAKISALTDAGEINMIDEAWLTAAIINSGPGMVAENQKRSLEDYLAMFAAILLFDSQLNIAREAVTRMSENMTGGNVHQIHLFSVNSGYYPLSYVLKLTYDSLVMGLQQARTEVQTQGVEVEIYGYVEKPTIYTADAWTLTRDAALKSTKIKMRFMIKLMNVLQNLLPQ